MRPIILLLACLLPLAAQAQIIRCTNPATHAVYYADRCSTGHQGAQVKVYDHSRLVPQPVVRRAAEQPDEFQQPQYRTAPAVSAPPPRPQLTYQQKIDRANELRMMRSRIGNRAPTLRERQAIAALEGGLGAPDASTANAAKPAPAHHAPPPAPRQIANCDPSGCWDTQGTRYNHAGPGTSYSSTGQFCQQVGNQLQCH